MSKETYNKIISKLQRMDEYIRYLEEIQKINKKDFVYDKIDREIIYEKLQNNLDDFKNFKKEVLSYLNKIKLYNQAK